MGKGLIISNILDFIKGKERVEHYEIEKYIEDISFNRGYRQIHISDINEIIFDLIIDGILKVGVVYSYGSTSSQYFVDKERLLNRIKLYNTTVC